MIGLRQKGDGWTDRCKKTNKISGQLQHGTTLHVKIEVCVYERETNGWSCLYIQRYTRRSEERDVYVARGHGRDDVIDMTGPVSPEERQAEIQMDGQKQRCSRGGVGLTDR